ncbi:efflux transporter outer membrane subunit [Bordetella genomosp. 11]|uniref:RND transporter n=1 Tax=Bordetella genomosp. 11 TaxID=1416808 RepID=A0A261UYU1_9BORD|nr:efflux transporter outer membrane subunit [Bordetella genomosp. 11]OZI67039.1 RND transporter [Bordetella genomosp. 11]
MIALTPIGRRAGRRLSFVPAALSALALLSGCAVGPDYVRPTMEIPAAYKEAGPWKTAQPGQVDPNQNWWEIYGDKTLDRLMAQANVANQTIAQAAAQYRQARALVAQARAAFWPQVTAGVSADRTRSMTNSGTKLGNTYAATLDASWEPDLWGAVRRSVEASNATAQSSAAQLAAARLSVQAALAQDYLQLRVTDEQKALFARTIAAFERSLKLTQSQYNAGVALRSDVALAEAQLRTAQASAIDLDTQRDQLEHAIAILTGRAPADFTLPPAPESWQANVPAIPAGVPSQLLERRPDIASAERLAAAANAQIGVEQAAYYPDLILSGGLGFSSGTAALSQWFNTPSRIWSLGAALAQTVFDGGLRGARVDEARAGFDAAVAQYKQTVLGGFQEVEDNLSNLRVLANESVAQDQAVEASRLSERLALAQYRAGTTTYLTVVTAQALTLSNERTAVDLLGRRLLSSVALIKATGGGWNAARLDTPMADAGTAVH